MQKFASKIALDRRGFGRQFWSIHVAASNVVSSSPLRADADTRIHAVSGGWVGGLDLEVARESAQAKIAIIEQCLPSEFSFVSALNVALRHLRLGILTQ